MKVVFSRKGFVSAARGQEFVFEPNEKALNWVKDIIQ